MIYLRSLGVRAQADAYPLNLPGLLALAEMPFGSPVTLFIGENGSGKSTLLEALARAISARDRRGGHRTGRDARFH